MDLFTLGWALLLGGLGGSAIILLKIYNENEWIKSKPKMMASIALGVISSFLMWIMGDGAAVFGLIAYFLAGATGPAFMTELLEKFSRKKKEKK